MMWNIDPSHERNLSRLSRFAGGFDIVLGILVLVAWSQNWQRVLEVVPGYPVMAPNTATAILIAGLLLLLSPQAKASRLWISIVCGAVIAGIGIAAIFENIFPETPLRANHAWESLLVALGGTPTATQVPLPALNTGVCFFLCGVAILLANYLPAVAQWIFLICLFVPIISLFGQIFPIPRLFIPLTEFPMTGMAVHTAIALFITGIGLMGQNPRESLLRRFLRRGASGDILRTMGLAFLVVPLLFGLAGLMEGYLGPKYSIYTYMGLVLAIVATFVVATALALKFVDLSEEKFRNLVENSYDAILLVNMEGKIEYVNARTTQMLGYEARELLHRPVEILVPDRYVETHVSLREEFLKHPQARPMGKNRDLFIRKKDGLEVPVDISLTPMLLSRQSLMTVVVRDISAVKKSEIQQRFLADSAKILTESLDYSDSLVKISEQFVAHLADFCVVFLKEGEEVRVKAVAHSNPAMVPFLRETAERYPSLNIGHIGKETDAGKVDLYETVTEETFERIAVNVDHLQRLRLIGAKSYLTVPLSARGNVFGILSLGITESRRKFSAEDTDFIQIAASRFALAADNFRMYQEAQKAIQDREDILSIVSHDLKNPIAVIDLASQLLALRLGSNPDLEPLRSLNQRVRRSNLQMKALVEKLLNYSKLQSGTFSIHARPIRLSELFEEIHEMFDPLARERQVNLKCSRHSDIELDGDFNALVQALSNLVANALKFTPAGGTIEVGGTVTGKGDVQLFVTDSGPGLPGEILEKIFERFWQPEPGKQGGTGLGLYIVKGIIEAHHGRVWAESELGKGARFLMQIPRSHRMHSEPKYERDKGPIQEMEPREKVLH